MLDKKDATDLIAIVNEVQFKGAGAERVAEIKAKLRAIIEAKEEPCPPATTA